MSLAERGWDTVAIDLGRWPTPLGCLPVYMLQNLSQTPEGGPLAAMLVSEPIFVPHHNRLGKRWTPKPLSWDVDLCPTLTFKLI